MITAQSRTLSTLLFVTLSSFFFLGTQMSSKQTAVIKASKKTTANNVISSIAVNNKNPPNTNTASVNASLKAPLPDFSHIYNTQEKKQQFFGYLIPIITSVNENVTHERDKIKTLQNTLNTTDTLSSDDESYLMLISKKYRVDASKGFNSTFFTSLLNKVDKIPPSLVLAQAANESAWGTSRFAIEGNNLFGQWCFSKGCGLVPEQRNDGADHEVAKFDSIFDSVKSYVLNLNRHAEYNQLRSIRSEIRPTGTPVNGIKLANGLEGYSERGLDYVNEIQSMIRFNNLSSLDKNA